jgi:Mg2+ and Co2+ transporter CorA
MIKTLPAPFTKGFGHDIIRIQGGYERMQKKLTVIGCTMWIIGLAASIIGMNLTGAAKSWVSITGNVVFLIGLGITGFVWLKKREENQ